MKRYSITEIAEIVGEKRTNIARYVQRHSLKEINIDRPYKNSLKYYDEEVLKSIKEEYLSEKAQHEYNKSVTANITASYSEVEQLLREQLANERQDKEKLQEQNTELLKLLNQQQQLTLISNKKLELVKLELKDSEVDQEKETENQNQNKKRKWYDFFRR